MGNFGRFIRHNKSIKNNQTSGQGIIEVVLAMAIFSILVASIASLSVGGFQALEQGGEQTEAEALVQEGIGAVRSIRDGAWNEVVYNKSGVEISGGEWIFSGESTTDVIGQFTRTITFSDVCRDSSHEIATCPASYTDIHSKKVTVTVEWTIRNGVTNTVQKVTYLTNWDSQEWTEDTTSDFSDGTFSSTENSTTLGDADGAIILQAQ